MAQNYGYNRPRVVLEESPLANFFANLPSTVLSFMQLNHQLQQAQINRDYAAAREDLSFARKDYLQTKAREDAWRDTLAKSGYSTKHITSPGEDLIEGNTSDILSATSTSEDSIMQLQELTSDLKKWAQKGKDWEKEFAVFEEADKDEIWRDFLMEGKVTLDEKGDVVGTGEFAEALKSLNTVELEKLKDENYRQAVMTDLRDESEAIKMFGQQATGTATLAKIGQGKYVSNIANALNTAETYSGIASIRAIEADILKYPDEPGVEDRMANVELNKLNIGRDYQYLALGISGLPLATDADDSIKASYLNTYNQMSLALSVARPEYATGGYGSTTGNQKYYNETLAVVYLNYQEKLKSDPEEASIFASMALQYFGVDLTDPSKLEELGITDVIETTSANREALSALGSIDNLQNDPLAYDPNRTSLIPIMSDIDKSLDTITAMSGQELFPGQLETKYRAMDYELAYTYPELSEKITQEEHLEHQRRSLVGATIRSGAGYEYQIEDAKLKDPDNYIAGASPILVKIGGSWTETNELPRSLSDYTIVRLSYPPEAMPTSFEAGPIGYYWDALNEEYRIKKSLTGL